MLSLAFWISPFIYRRVFMLILLKLQENWENLTPVSNQIRGIYSGLFIEKTAMK